MNVKELYDAFEHSIGLAPIEISASKSGDARYFLEPSWLGNLRSGELVTIALLGAHRIGARGGPLLRYKARESLRACGPWLSTVFAKSMGESPFDVRGGKLRASIGSVVSGLSRRVGAMLVGG